MMTTFHMIRVGDIVRLMNGQRGVVTAKADVEDTMIEVELTPTIGPAPATYHTAHWATPVLVVDR
jgi:hypothetical protein